jgi:ATP-dependent RNA helicase DHX37/DHR1
VFLSPAATAAVVEAAAAITGAASAKATLKKRRDPAEGAMEVGTPGDAALRRALLVGWADRVARRAKASEQAAAHTAAENEAGGAGGVLTKATRYRPAMLDAPVFLHPSSTLYRAAPDYVVYTDLLQTAKRPYLMVNQKP